MKKSLVLLMALAMAVVFTVPALAFHLEGGKGEKLYVGGLWLTDFGARNLSKELSATKNDLTQLYLNVPAHSRFRGSVESGNVGGYWEFGVGGTTEGTAGTDDRYIETRLFYGWYKFGNCRLTIGKNHAHVFSVHPFQNMGFSPGSGSLHVAGFGWGSVYDQRDPQVRFSQDVSKAFGYDISLVQPRTYSVTWTATPATATAPAVTASQKSYDVFPLVALKLRMNFGMVSLMPAGYYQTVKWDSLPNGYDDSMNSWYAVLPVIVKAGAFTGTFQIGYGQNIANPLALESAYQEYQRNGAGQIKNTTGLNGFVDLAFTAGAVTPHFYIGYDKAENTDVYVGDKAVTRMMYGVSAAWKITDNFIVAPEFTYYDYGKNPRVASNPDLGKEWLAGVQFQFVF